MLKLEINFIEGDYKGQIWVIKNLELEFIFHFYMILGSNFNNEHITYVYTGRGRFFIADYVRNQKRLIHTSKMN